MPDIAERIQALKRERNAVILAHLYQRGEVQDIADFTGDSFELARKAAQARADVIVFCGVYFMAESAKLLNPGKTVLLPVLAAGCPMADMVTPEDVRKLRAQYPEAAVACYVNSTAAVKAESDICCTSSNAARIVKSLPNRQVIFVPDRNLGNFVSLSVPEKEIVLCAGFCPTHERVSAEDVRKARESMPGAPVLVHPECAPAVVEAADWAGSTSQIIEYVGKSDKRDFVIGTEEGILHSLQKRYPDRKFALLSPRLFCANMKRTGLEDVLYALENGVHAIELDDDIAGRARLCLESMLKA